MSKSKKHIYPVLPLRDIVIFPHMIAPIFVGRSASIAALEAVAASSQKKIMLVLQSDSDIDEPTGDTMHKVGVLGTLLQLLRLPDGTIKLLVQGGERKKIIRYEENTDYPKVNIHR